MRWGLSARLAEVAWITDADGFHGEVAERLLAAGRDGEVEAVLARVGWHRALVAWIAEHAAIEAGLRGAVLGAGAEEAARVVERCSAMRTDVQRGRTPITNFLRRCCKNHPAAGTTSAMTVQAREVPAREVADGPRRDRLYDEAIAAHGPALARLARAYEADGELCRDLQQEIHVALWRSLAGFDERCSLRTWVYRVAHNVACTHVVKARRGAGMVGLDELADLPAEADDEAHADRRIALERLLRLIHRLAPLERQVILLYLEGMDTAAIAEITGLSTSNLNTKVHRIKKILADRFHEGGV